MPFTIGGGSNIQPGTYKGQLLRVESGVPTAFGTARKWYFLLDVNGSGEEITAMTSENTGPQSKAFGWLKALTGRTPRAGEVIEDPVGKTVMIEVVHNEKGFATVGDLIPIVEPVQTEAGIPR